MQSCPVNGRRYPVVAAQKSHTQSRLHGFSHDGCLSLVGRCLPTTCLVWPAVYAAAKVINPSGEAMINRESRKRTCRILKQLALGKITNYQCENEFLDLPKDDPVIYALFRSVKEINGEYEESLRPVF